MLNVRVIIDHFVDTDDFKKKNFNLHLRRDEIHVIHWTSIFS